VGGVTLESLQHVAIAVAEERSLDAILHTLVQGLLNPGASGGAGAGGGSEGFALIRVWLMGPGDICEVCPMREECADRSRCLHLVASAGRSLKGKEDWSRLTGDFRRIPLNARKVGHIGATGASVLIPDLESEQRWKPRADWVARESIRSFAGHPLVFRGEILGVLGVFSRTVLDNTMFDWLKIFANQAAVSLANARAFAEIERLREQLELENSYLREEVKSALSPSDMVGKSPALQRVLQQIELVAPTDASVLVLGESGTGKELIARRLHERSLRRHRPLIKVNCASIPRELFESEFFGHVKGAFTGAVRDRAGRFQAADGGTLFLDEIGENPFELQGKLLRAIQEGQFERVGEDKARRVDVRIIAATNRDLEHEIAHDRFRRDLYYRLSVFPIQLPPLRERIEDIPELAAHFIKMASARIKVPAAVLSAQHLDSLKQYAWPGNIRELQNVIERAVILARGGPLPLDLSGPLSASTIGRQRVKAHLPEPEEGVVTDSELRQRERRNLLAALTRTRWKIYGPDGAAALLGLKPTTLASRMKALGIERPGAEP
jgi:transcriptional regulator with GAF, ATPase, and Fis domain